MKLTMENSCLLVTFTNLNSSSKTVDWSMDWGSLFCPPVIRRLRRERHKKESTLNVLYSTGKKIPLDFRDFHTSVKNVFVL